MSEAVKNSGNLTLHTVVLSHQYRNRKSNTKCRAHKTHTRRARRYLWFHQGKIFLEPLKLEVDSPFGCLFNFWQYTSNHIRLRCSLKALVKSISIVLEQIDVLGISESWVIYHSSVLSCLSSKLGLWREMHKPAQITT